MGLQINTNEVSLAAQRNLEITDRRFKGTVQRLASGSRIIQASDDPAGLAISDGLEATIRSIGAATRNAQDGISLIQVYEGGTTEINNMLVRMRELAIQSASDSIGDRERAMLDNEVQQLKQEIDRLACSTKFNGQQLLSGEAINIEFQVGSNNEDDVDRIRFNPGDTNLKTAALGVSGFNVIDRDDARDGLDKIDEALTKVNEVRARVGASQSRLQTTISAQQIFTENLMAAKSRIRDADMAKETTALTRDSILRQAGVAVLTQANQTPALALSLLRAQ
ncbi:MAG: flagellin FliC [Deltaproteobacteria bacterium]|nr:flagellin FliC [Deltaproteobacteria bacterium]